MTDETVIPTEEVVPTPVEPTAESKPIEPIKKNFKQNTRFPEKPKEPVVTTVDKTEPPNDFDTLVSGIEVTGTTYQKIIIQKLKAYRVEMGNNKRLSIDEAVRQQYGLWTIIQNVIEKVSDEEFSKCWPLILQFFNKYSDDNEPFSGSMVNRYSEYWARNPMELTVFQRILNLILLTCNPNNRRSALRQVSMDKTLKDLITEKGRQRIIQFYDI